jgi:beta-N-acetylhexosaminidase
VVLAAGAGFGIAVAGGGGNGHRSSAPRTAPTPAAGSSFLTRIVPGPAGHGGRATRVAVPASVARTARRMSLQRKVAQLFVVGFQGQDLTAPVFAQLRRQDLGGIVIDRANYVSPDQLRQQAGEAGVIAKQAKHLPPWVFAQQEGGSYNALRGLPPATAPGDARSVAQAGAQARQAGKALRSLGVNAVIGPMIDVGASGEGDDAYGSRVYSDEPRQVAAYAGAVVRAYRAARVFTAPEHFPGLGSANQPTEEGAANVGQSVAQLSKRDLVPFRAAFRAGTPGVMLSSGMYVVDDFVTPGSVSKAVITGLLRHRERFGGVAMTDDLADPGVSVNYSVPAATVSAVKGGADLLYISGSAKAQQAAYAAVLRAVKRKKIPRRRIDEAVLRILTAKRGVGLIR